MKKLFVISLLLISVFSFSQEKKKKYESKDLDREINLSLDSLSKIYKKNVFAVKVIIKNDTLKKYITYNKNNELYDELIEVKPIK
jgi:hypothetical protein